MFGTLAVAQQHAGGVDRDQAEVIAKAIHDGLEQGDHVTSDQFRAGLAEIANLDTRLSTQIAELRTEQRTGLANLETRLVRWMVGTVIATGHVDRRNPCASSDRGDRLPGQVDDQYETNRRAGWAPHAVPGQLPNPLYRRAGQGGAHVLDVWR